jgi:hypothetical protein
MCIEDRELGKSCAWAWRGLSGKNVKTEAVLTYTLTKDSSVVTTADSGKVPRIDDRLAGCSPGFPLAGLLKKPD